MEPSHVERWKLVLDGAANDKILVPLEWQEKRVCIVRNIGDGLRRACWTHHSNHALSIAASETLGLVQVVRSARLDAKQNAVDSVRWIVGRFDVAFPGTIGAELVKSQSVSFEKACPNRHGRCRPFPQQTGEHVRAICKVKKRLSHEVKFAVSECGMQLRIGRKALLWHGARRLEY